MSSLSQTQFAKEALLAANMATFTRSPSTQNARAFVQNLVEQTEQFETAYGLRQRARKKADLATFTATAGAFAADLLHHYKNPASDHLMYRAADKMAWGNTKGTFTHFDALLKAWGALGWIETSGFYRSMDDFDGQTYQYDTKARRMRGTPTFIELAQSFEITPEVVGQHFTADISLGELIRINVEGNDPAAHRRAKAHLSPNNPRYVQRRQELISLNAHLDRFRFNLADSPQLRRSYNRGDHAGFRFDHGGRFYAASEGDWIKQKDIRQSITIDGEVTVELDVHASHLLILYGLTGTPLLCRGDLYAVEGVDRWHAKQAFTAATGKGGPLTRWPRELGVRYEKKFGVKRPKGSISAKDAWSALLRTHSVLGHLRPVELDWGRLQNQEAECFLQIMTTLAQDHDIPALPIHDSLIVPQSAEETVRRVMIESYERNFNVTPTISDT